MAGKFDVNSTTFMNRHTPGVNSTGMYLISGIPYILTASGAVANDGTNSSAAGGKVITLPSLSREVTFVVTGNAGESVEVAFEKAKVINAGGAGDGNAVAGVNFLSIPTGTTVTLPVRVKKIWYRTVADTTVQVAATLTGLSGSAYENYPVTKGDGLLS